MTKSSNAEIELQSGGIGGKLSGSANHLTIVVICMFIAFFLYANHQFGTLHIEIATLETSLAECEKLMREFITHIMNGKV